MTFQRWRPVLRGEIWRYDRRWVKEKSGTSRDLRAVCVDTKGTVWAVGDQGTCLRRTGTRWAPVADDGEGADCTSVVEFNGSIYATANWSVVLKLNAKKRFVPVDFGRCRIPSTAAHLKVRDGLLYCYGPKDLVRFDGTTWKKLLALSS